MTGRTRLIPLLLCGVLWGGPAAHAEGGRHWRIEDIVTVPTDFELSLASDGLSLAYLERRADIEKDETVSVLHILDLRSGISREILRAASAEQLRPLPDRSGWSLLIDLGEGLQLYTLDTEGKIEPLLAGRAEVTVGQTEGGLFAVRSGAPRRIGILYHAWSPDGRWLWYATLKPRRQQAGLAIDEAVVGQRSRRRAPVTATVELRIRAAGGDEWLVASRPSSDRLAFYYGGNIQWTRDGAHFQLEQGGAGAPTRIGAFAWSFAAKASAPMNQAAEFPAIGLVQGPNGGVVASEGFGSALALTETRADGRKISYGRHPFIIADPRAAGSWLSTDRRTALLGVRATSHPRYGLVRLTRRGATPLFTRGSLTACDFRRDLAWGICVEEGLNQVPRLVHVDPGKARVRFLRSLSPAHEAIEPLRATFRRWTNRLGYFATGFILWPRDYQAGRRYPAVIITHGSDADERFASPDMQWNYPAQIFAERGLVVILMNDPSARQRAELWNAYMQWSGGPGTQSPDQLRRLIWLNGVYSFEDAIAELADRGFVDPDRVGIAGYSRGSQMVNVAMTQSTRFHAASSGDGAYLEPASYPDAQDGYHMVFGGPPAGPFLDAYRSLSPSLRAGRACGPILQQMASPFAGAIDFHSALREARVPAQISLYPGETTATDETHLFHIPSNRLRAMKENLAWFDYWLRDRRNSETIDSATLERWSNMAAQWQPRCVQDVPAP